MKKEITNWQLTAFYPYTPILKRSSELNNELTSILPWFEATVPGSVHKTLLNNKYINDPYFEMNSLSVEWIENKWWLYQTHIDITKYDENKRYFIQLDGVDYKADIFFNKHNIGIVDNPFSSHCFEITQFITKNDSYQLEVMLKEAPDMMGQIGYTSKTQEQKSRFNYKWDFTTRLVHLGIHGPVYLVETGKIKINETDLSTHVVDKDGWINAKFKLSGQANYDIEVKLNNQVITSKLMDFRLTKNSLSFKYQIKDVNLWWPNGMGAQSLYDLAVEVFVDNKLSDSITKKIGFKTLYMIPNETAQHNALPYTFVVNHEKFYVKGVNLVPLDVLIGDILNSKYENLLSQLRDANINLIRVWGGGVIETEYFYGLCDKLGILVWQDFIQSSSGIDNIPSKHPQFLKQLKKVSKQAILDRKHHISLAVWSGGNELTDENKIPATFDDTNLKMLKKLVNKYDQGRLMYPTSGSGPLSFGNLKKKGQNHDIHGSWKFELSEHYNFYNNIDSLFHSEFGVDGLTNLESMKKFMSSKNLVVSNIKENYVWRHHGEWWDTSKRDMQVFGNFQRLEDYIFASQFLQAEGIRYAVEANRRRAYQNSGSIVWQANESFPNVSCTSLIDYYGEPKLALGALKNAFAPANINMRYDKLVYDVGDNFNISFYATTDKPLKDAKIIITCKRNDETTEEIYQKTISLNKPTTHLKSVNFIVQKSDLAFDFKLCIQTDKLYENHITLLVRSNDNKVNLSYLKSLWKKELSYHEEKK